MKIITFVAFLFFLAGSARAQQPQTSTAPIFAANAKYVNGVAPGYWPTAGSGLTLNVSAGTANCAGTIVTYAAGTLTMTNNTTNYVYLNTGASCVPAVKTTTFVAADIPVAVVVTSGGVITTITDDRTAATTGSSASSPVTSVFSRTGGVAATSGDYTCAQVTNCPGSDAKTIPACMAPGGTASAGWTYASGQFSPTLRAGSNNIGCGLQAIPSTGAVAQFLFALPAAWLTTQPTIAITYASGSNTTGTVIWTVSSACSKGDGSVTDDPAFVAETAFASQTMANANRDWVQSGQYTHITAGNNCVANGPIIIKIALSGTAASNINFYQAILYMVN